MDSKIIFIVGPTAAGKTDLAIEVAKKYNGEIISADSMQIYKYMPIGSAQPTKEQQIEVMHHMIDFVDPKDDYNVALYQKEARKTISGIFDRGKLPVVCGGTGLYINSLFYNYGFTPAQYDYEYRNSLDNFVRENGRIALHNKLRSIDSVSAENIHPNNTKRVIRALEVYHLTGKSFSSFQDGKCLYYNKSCILGLNPNRSALYEGIEKRIDKMICLGLLDEVKNLVNYGCSLANKSMQGLGYKELIEYINGDIDFNTAVDNIKLNTRHFAKRQLTWFRRIEYINWIDFNKNDSLDDIVTKTFNIVGNYSFN